MASPGQGTAKPVIGFLSSQSSDAFKDAQAAFHQGLKQMGYVEGDNVVVEHDWAEGQQQRLKEQTAALVDSRVDLIAALGGGGPALLAKAATKEIPILFVSGFDPVKVGLTEKLDDLRRPNGNLTGVHVTTTELGVKRLGVLRELLPKASTIGLLVNPKG